MGFVIFKYELSFSRTCIREIMVFGGWINCLMGRMMPPPLWKGSRVLCLGREAPGQTARVLAPDTPFIICVTLGKSLTFSVT